MAKKRQKVDAGYQHFRNITEAGSYGLSGLSDAVVLLRKTGADYKDVIKWVTMLWEQTKGPAGLSPIITVKTRRTQ